MRIRRHSGLASLFLALVLTLFAPISARPQALREPARQLANRIVAKIGSGTAINLVWENQSSLPPESVQAVRQEVEAELRASGMQVVDAQQAIAEISITLSENWEGYLWVAEVRQGSVRETVMLPVARPAQAPVATGIAPALVLRKTALWSQDAPMLDAAAVGAGNSPQILVLEPARVTLYSGGQAAQSFPIPRQGPWPRDLRGRIILRRDHLFDVYLPGMQCSSAQRGAPAMECRASDDPWPLGGGGEAAGAFFSPARKFFTGALAGGFGGLKSTAPFYTAAHLHDGSSDAWLLAGVDGRVHYFTGVNDIAAPYKDWGSDLAGVKTECGSGWQVLATRAGNRTQADAVQAYEMAGREPVPAGAPAEFSGPITSLWTTAEGSSAVAVSRNLETGKYEAFSLSIACGH